MLRQLAEDAGLTEGDIVRQAIRRTWSERFGDRKPPKN